MYWPIFEVYVKKHWLSSIIDYPASELFVLQVELKLCPESFQVCDQPA